MPIEIESRRQNYGEEPLKIRETDQYQSEYIKHFVEKWDELIDWKAREQSEGEFFIRELQRRGVRKVLDVATGTGFHSVRLLEAGFEVASLDGSMEMLGKAFDNGRRRGHVLRTIHEDWRWLNRSVHEKFDAVICLGNSFTHLFKEQDRRKALAEFSACLRHDGVLVLDHRNYDGILDDGLSPRHVFYYCGKDVRAEPEYADEGLARFRYEFKDGSVFHLNMFPLRCDYVRRLMTEVGFQRVLSYGDFQETEQHESPDFFVHFAEKSYPEDGK